MLNVYHFTFWFHTEVRMVKVATVPPAFIGIILLNPKLIDQTYSHNTQMMGSRLAFSPRTSKSYLRSSFISLRKVFSKPKIILIVTAIVFAFNWIVFDDPIKGPLGNKSLPPSIKSFRHLREPVYLNILHNSYGFQGSETIPVKTKELIPSVDDSSVLRQLTLDNLFKLEIHSGDEGDKKLFFYSDEFFHDPDADQEDSKKQKENKDTDAVKSIKLASKDFKKMGRKVYAGKENPKIVLVTALDFNKYDDAYLKTVAYNRIKYTKQQGYGLYERWVEEFVPRLQKTGNLGTNWWKIMLLREAINAFPHAEYFWFLDEKSLIVQGNVRIEDLILNPEMLQAKMLRDQPIVPPGSAIKTYKNTRPEDVSLILTQNNLGISTDSIIVKNDIQGKAMLEYWISKLYRAYRDFFENEVRALEHMLQWHPLVLSRTALVPTRLINAEIEKTDGKKNSAIDYQEGDMVINLGQCEKDASCVKLASKYLRN